MLFLTFPTFPLTPLLSQLFREVASGCLHVKQVPDSVPPDGMELAVLSDMAAKAGSFEATVSACVTAALSRGGSLSAISQNAARIAYVASSHLDIAGRASLERRVEALTQQLRDNDLEPVLPPPDYKLDFPYLLTIRREGPKGQDLEEEDLADEESGGESEGEDDLEEEGSEEGS